MPFSAPCAIHAVLTIAESLPEDLSYTVIEEYMLVGVAVTALVT